MAVRSSAWLDRHLYHSQDGIRIFCGDNRQLMPMLNDYDLLLTDPPYGIGRCKSANGWTTSKKAVARVIDYGAQEWDGETPAAWVLQAAIEKAEHAIIWGGNYYGLPASSCWLVWNKDNEGNRNADCELAWTNLPQAVRMIKFRWRGMLQENMTEKEIRYHPAQKPVPVMQWAIGQTEAQTILDPWMGSGSTLIAARAKGLKADGIEINEQYCEAAKRRLAQGVLLAV
jgi:DNA modification methylase